MARVTRERKKGVVEEKPGVYSRLHSLLRVMRIIEQHEEQLCSMMHEIKSSGVVSEAMRAELSGLLDEMPLSEYQNDLEGLRQALVSKVPGMRGSQLAQKADAGAPKRNAKTRR